MRNVVCFPLESVKSGPRSVHFHLPASEHSVGESWANMAPILDLFPSGGLSSAVIISTTTTKKSAAVNPKPVPPSSADVAPCGKTSYAMNRKSFYLVIKLVAFRYLMFQRQDAFPDSDFI